ncbi:hypothetical protein P691DRAFT_805390 [Macrolepiota fuliginosa MF-IS2]|uniref:GAR domain-containing protein n=1 Tax=Macrolepiota fuliginosa MF-IS2 TaxID=1400762 RepID=A0A9P5XK44_9AGAR|nr:hypothetical protein P691DRAFT_805390 [Macrolepiota fuliginosa MF-IS2]
MSNIINPSPDPELDTPVPVVLDPTSTAPATEGATTTTAEQQKEGEEEALESHEVIELQAFSEKKPWIEERIRFLEEMPPVEVFVGLDAIRASAEIVPGLPSRAILEEWMAKHDAVDKETEVFDTVELEKLRQLTKAATHRNLSPADTDVIELTLTTIFALDKLLQLLRDRSFSLELLATRLVWEEHRVAAWVERRLIIEDFTQFIAKRVRWNTSMYENPVKDEYPLGRRGSINSFASASSDTSVNSAAFSRSARFKLAEFLSRDAAHFGSRVTALRHGKIASAGKALDKLIDISRVPVPEELLDEQDRLEEKGINELEQIGKFAMNLVMQWRKADEIYVETIKDQVTAQNLLEEIETAKLHHPTQRQCNSFVSRADALLKRLSVRVNPVTTPQFFPYPTHPLFADQQEFNAQLAQTLAAEIQTAIDLVNKVNISAKQYQTMYEAVKRLDTVLEDGIETFTSFKTYLKQMEIGVPSSEGDGSAPNLSTERCLDTTRHAVFLALWPSVSDEITEALERTGTILPEFQVSLALFDASGVRDPEYRRQALVEVQQLQTMKEKVEAAYQKTLAKLAHLREARRISSHVDGIQQRFVDLRLQLLEAMERTRWRQDSLNSDLPLTPESSPAVVEEDVHVPPPDFLKQLAHIRQSISNEIDTPFAPLSHHLETPLREHLTRKLVGLKNLGAGCEEMINMLTALQQQASTMTSAREECHALQLRIEDAKIRSTYIADNILTDAVGNGSAAEEATEFYGEVDHIQADVKSFTEGLVFKVPFIARLSPSLGASTSRQRSLSLDPNASSPGAHETHFDLSSVDAAVRADCNSFVMRLGGEMDGLLKCKHHLTLARLSKDLDNELKRTINQIYEVTQELNSWKLKREQITKDESYLASLSGLLERVEAYSTSNRKSISQRFSPHRELLRQMEASSTTLDQPIRETLYMARVRAVDDAELRFNTWAEDFASFKSELDQAIRNELFRLDEFKRAEEQRKREEEMRQKAEEEERRRMEEEKRLREEVEREEAVRLAEEARIHQEEQRLVAMEAEKLRLEQERIEAEKRALLEKQEAEAEWLRLEQQYNATMEAQRLQSEKERDNLASRLRQLEDELNSTKRLQQDQQRTAAEETAKTVSELERQRRDLEDLLKEYRNKLEGLKTLENQTQQAQKQTSKHEIQIMTDAGQDVFTFEVSPVTPMPRSQAMLELEAHVHTLRRRLSALVLKDAAKSSVNLPTQDQTQRYRHELTAISKENDALPASVEDTSTNAVLRSFRAELDAAEDQMEHFEKLAELNSSFQNCDAALSDLLEHIDSYPAPPAVTMASFSAPQLALPEDQLSARVRFTRDAISTAEELARPHLSDSRVSTEHSRIMQTWNELSDMASDRLGGKKSRPGSTVSSQESSGRNSAASVRTTQSTTTNRSSHSKKDSYSGLSGGRLPKPPQPPSSRLLEPPQPIPPQRRAISGGAESTPRSTSRMSSTSTRSVSGSFNTSLYQPTFSSRQRTTSLSSSTNTTPVPTLTKRSSHNPLRAKVPAGSQARRPTSPTISEASSTRSSVRSFATTSRASRPARASLGGGSTWARAPRNSLSSIIPPRAATPQKKEKHPPRKKYVPNPKSKLDVAVGDVVNNLPVGINVEGLTETWKDQSGKYWIGNQDPKLCFCRILRSQTVMVRVGGGWQELSKFIKDHFADSFRLLSESPPHPGGPEERWISSTTLLEAAEIITSTTTMKSPPPEPPRTPEPRMPFVPSFSLLTPSGHSPRSIGSIGSSPSTKGSPLTPLQFIRRAEPDAALLRPVTPTKQPRQNSQAPLRLWRP